MKQGEVWHTNLNPIKGSDQAGLRPEVILSGNLMNKYLNVVTTCPLKAKIKKAILFYNLTLLINEKLFPK